MEIQLRRGIEVRSTVAHCHAAPCICYTVQSIQRYMSSAQHSGSFTLQPKFCRSTNMVVSGSCVAQVCLGHKISPLTSSYGVASKPRVQSYLAMAYRGLEKHAHSQLRQNQQYSSVNFRVTGLAQHSGGFHSKTTNALCLLCFVLCTCRGHKSSAMGIQLWRGIEVGSPVAP